MEWDWTDVPQWVTGKTPFILKPWFRVKIQNKDFRNVLAKSCKKVLVWFHVKIYRSCFRRIQHVWRGKVAVRFYAALKLNEKVKLMEDDRERAPVLHSWRRQCTVFTNDPLIILCHSQCDYTTPPLAYSFLMKDW